MENQKAGKDAIDMEGENADKQDIIRAKQAISPDGLEDRADQTTTMPGYDEPEDSPIEGIATEPLPDRAPETGDEAATTHPNRNRDGKVDIDKPAYD